MSVSARPLPVAPLAAVTLPVETLPVETPAVTRGARIVGVEVHLPAERLLSGEIEARLAASGGFAPPPGFVERVTGIRSRPLMEPHEQASDLAVAAAAKLLAGVGAVGEEIDLLVFCSASQDLVEPATAHIVAAKLGLNCPVMDIKNACNSFLNGLEVADALIDAGRYRRILLVSGESPSRAVRWELKDPALFAESFAGYTMGDAGAAVLLEASAEEGPEAPGFLGWSFTAKSEFWDVGTLPAGGSARPRDPEAGYFSMDGERLRDAFLALGPGSLHESLSAWGLRWEDFAVVCVHQVSAQYRDIFTEGAGVPRELLVPTVEEYGNLASCSLPLQLRLAQDLGRCGPGDLVALVGLAGGVSLGLTVVRL